MRGGEGGGGGGGRRRAKDPPPTDRSTNTPSLLPDYNFTTTTNNRDSDATFCSTGTTNRPSSIGGGSGRFSTTDRSYQASATRIINEYLSSHKANISLKPPLPSAKDITEAVRFLFHRLDFPTTASTIKLDEDLPLLLKHLNCPYKLNKSALKAPGTPHAWPALLSVIHWLVEIARYSDHISSNSSTTTKCFLEKNKLLIYALESYNHYIRGDDQAVDELDSEFTAKMEEETGASLEKVKALETEVAELEAKIHGMRSAPSAREALEKDRVMLEDDVHKFYDIVDRLKMNIEGLEKDFQAKERELENKVQENRRICEESEELKKTAEAQKVNLRDAERMKRELQAVERDIADAEAARTSWEEKSWDLDASLRQKFKELENLSIECNKAIRRLKLRNDFQYMLNTKGSTAADVLGINYKSTLKPTLDAYANEIKRNSVEKLEEFISLQQQSQDNDSMLKAKKSRLEELQSRIDEAESQISKMRKEIQYLASRCSAEATRLVEDFEMQWQQLENMEREADDYLKLCSAKLEDVVKRTNEEIQKCADELLLLVDTVSKYKEHVESTVLEMKNDLSGTAAIVANAYKGSVAAEFGISSNVSF